MTYFIAEAYIVFGNKQPYYRQRVLRLPDPNQWAIVSLLSKQMIKLPGFSGGNVWVSDLADAWEFADTTAAANRMRERDLSTERCFIIDSEAVTEWKRRHHLWRVKRKAAQIR